MEKVLPSLKTRDEMPILVEHDTFNQTSLFDLQCFDKICVLLLAAYGCMVINNGN